MGHNHNGTALSYKMTSMILYSFDEWHAGGEDLNMTASTKTS